MILDAGKLTEWINRRQINLVHCVPSVFRAIVSEELDPTSFASLNYILMAGEPLLPADVEKWMAVYGERVQLVNLYGPSETTMVKFCYFVKPADRHRRFIPIGQPMEGARALVVDEQGEICPPGVVGEIYIRTPFRTLGYYKRPELTAEVFIQNPFSEIPNDLVYKTGDLARILEDGNFEFLGRKDSQVKIRGVRVELTEIENLLRSHPSVKNVAVLDRDDATGNKFLRAYLVLSEAVEPQTLQNYLSQSLPEYMVPTSFVRLDALPLNVNGKVDRRALLACSQASAQREKEFVAPRTPVEETLAGIWQQVLGVDRVSVHDNFFESGGHSLLATRLFSRIRAELGVEAPLRTLFESPTVAQLALTLTHMQAEQEDEEEMARMIEEIRRLSEADLDSTLDEEIQATKNGPAS
jgi:acyl-coenzyme A synthetase/AMP-(fatty) acid ligase